MRAPRSVWEEGFSYFQDLKPIDQIGHSILIYRVTPDQAERLSAQYWPPHAEPVNRRKSEVSSVLRLERAWLYNDESRRVVLGSDPGAGESDG